VNKPHHVTAMQTEGLSKTEAIRAVEGFMAAVTEGLAQDERVSLFGFGTFSLVDHRSRARRNPRTGEKVIVPARTTITFSSGKHLSDQVNRNDKE